MDLEQVKLGFCTTLGFQLIRLMRVVADRLSFRMILGLTLLFPYSFYPNQLENFVPSKLSVFRVSA